MASNYGRNFGFRRSDESMAIREGRQKVPAAGTYRQGQPISIDEANPGWIRHTEAADAPVTGWTGLLVQEDAWDRSIYQSSILETGDLGGVINNRLCTIWSGNGTKVWFKNTGAQLRADGRSIEAAELVDFTGGIAVGDYLGVSVPGKWGVVSDETTAQMRVTLTNGTDYLEAVLLK